MGGVEHVARDGEGGAAGGVDGAGYGGGFGAVDVLDYDVGAFAGEERGCCCADALAGAGYDAGIVRVDFFFMDKCLGMF